MSDRATTPHLDRLLPSVVRALLHPGVPEAFSRYQEAAELLECAVTTGERAEQEDIEVLDSPRVARAARLADRFRSDVLRFRREVDTLLGSPAGSRLGASLRMASPSVLARALPLVEAERARGVALVALAREEEDGDEDALGEPDPIPDPRLTKKECSCGRRVRAHLFDEHTRTCGAVDRTPIVDRDAEPANEEENVSTKIDFDHSKALALRGEGKTLAEIATALGVSLATVQRRLGKAAAGPTPAAGLAPLSPPHQALGGSARKAGSS